MLVIDIPAAELWDEKNQEFIQAQHTQLRLEHSLVSISKWEAKWCKPFLSKSEKNYEETIDYIRCMSIDEITDPYVFGRLSLKDMKRINEYIEAPMTATRISTAPKRTGREIITSELLYYQMIAAGVPFECQFWHLNRLMTLLQVCAVKSKPPKKMSRRDIMRQNRSLNAARRSRMNSRG